MHTTDANLTFLREKIFQAQSGSCCIETGTTSFEAPVLQTEKIDSYGNIYFYIPELQQKSIVHSDVCVSYYNPALAYCVKIKASADIVPDHLKIVYSFGESRLQYLQIRGTIRSVEFIDQHKPLAKIKNAFRELTRNVAMLFY